MLVAKSDLERNRARLEQIFSEAYNQEDGQSREHWVRNACQLIADFREQTNAFNRLSTALQAEKAEMASALKKFQVFLDGYLETFPEFRSLADSLSLARQESDRLARQVESDVAQLQRNQERIKAAAAEHLRTVGRTDTVDRFTMPEGWQLPGPPHRRFPLGGQSWAKAVEEGWHGEYIAEALAQRNEQIKHSISLGEEPDWKLGAGTTALSDAASSGRTAEYWVEYYWRNVWGQTDACKRLRQRREHEQQQALLAQLREQEYQRQRQAAENAQRRAELEQVRLVIADAVKASCKAGKIRRSGQLSKLVNHPVFGTEWFTRSFYELVCLRNGMLRDSDIHRSLAAIQEKFGYVG